MIAIGFGKLLLSDQHDFKCASLEATTRVSLQTKYLNAQLQLIALKKHADPLVRNTIAAILTDKLLQGTNQLMR